MSRGAQTNGYRKARARKAKGPHAAQRTCIGGCNKMFLSEGPWNRICPKCAARNEEVNARHARLSSTGKGWLPRIEDDSHISQD